MGNPDWISRGVKKAARESERSIHKQMRLEVPISGLPPFIPKSAIPNPTSEIRNPQYDPAP